MVAALLANVGVAVAKGFAFAVTGSTSMAAEAIHSTADSANQSLLLLGQRRARRGPTRLHPFGHGSEGYFWAFVVSMVLFTGGGLFSLFEAEEKLRRPHELHDSGWAFATLALAIVFESLSLWTAIRRSRSQRKGQGWAAFISTSKDAEIPVVLLEDSGALIGLAFAAAGVTLAELTGDSRWDALGSFAIGVLLVVIAFLLAREMKSLLIGESASDSTVRAIHGEIVRAHGVIQVTDLRTLHLGPLDILVAARVAVDPRADVVEVIGHVEGLIAAAAPEATSVYVMPVEDD